MPCYRLFCLAKPGLGLEQQAAVIRAAALAVLDGGGVLMDVQSYGEMPLAYPVRPAGQRFDEVRCHVPPACTALPSRQPCSRCRPATRPPRSGGSHALCPECSAPVQAHMWQLYFHSHPKALNQLNHGLKVRSSGLGSAASAPPAASTALRPGSTDPNLTGLSGAHPAWAACSYRWTSA